MDVVTYPCPNFGLVKGVQAIAWWPRQQAIAITDVAPDICRHVATLSEASAIQFTD